MAIKHLILFGLPFFVEALGDTVQQVGITKNSNRPWRYPKDSNQSCVIVDFDAEFHFTYIKSDNTTKSIKINLPNEATVQGGICLNDTNTQSISLAWNSNTTELKSATNIMSLEFVQNSTSNKYMLKNITITIDAINFPNSTFNKSVLVWTDNVAWNVEVGYSYHCSSPPAYNLTSPTNITSAQLILHGEQEEAFRKGNGTGFSRAIDCAGGSTSDVVPIVVACVLAALVIIVLVTYLIGRRRSHARGYLSM